MRTSQNSQRNGQPRETFDEGAVVAVCAFAHEPAMQRSRRPDRETAARPSYDFWQLPARHGTALDQISNQFFPIADANVIEGVQTREILRSIERGTNRSA
jgi:hypothetical protein